MAHAEGVERAFAASGEGSEPVFALDGLQPVAASGQDFMRIGLMPHVPHQPVMRRLKDIMERDRELDRSQTGGEVATHLAYGLNQVLTQLGGERFEI